MVEIDPSSQRKRCDDALKERQVRVPITNEFTGQPERIAWLAGRVSAFCVHLLPPRQRNSTYEAVLELVGGYAAPGCKLNARPILFGQVSPSKEKAFFEVGPIDVDKTSSTDVPALGGR